jgi:hypothetical protein
MALIIEEMGALCIPKRRRHKKAMECTMQCNSLIY